MEKLVKLKKWALGAEIASGVAVVITLALLIVEIRSSTKATRVATYENISSGLSSLDISIASDPDLARLFWERHDSNDLNELEAGRRFLLNRAAARSFETAYFAFVNGSLNQTQWERFERNMCRLWRITSPEERSGYANNLTDEFVSYLDTQCGESNQE
jgi:hypothetical protein